MQDMHKNDIDDLRIRMENEENNRDAKIYLHNLSLKPFPIFSVSKKQISVLKKLKEHRVYLCEYRHNCKNNKISSIRR